MPAWQKPDILSLVIANYITPQQLIVHQSNPARCYLNKQLFAAKQLGKIKSALIILLSLLVKLQAASLLGLACYKPSKIHCQERDSKVGGRRNVADEKGNTGLLSAFSEGAAGGSVAQIPPSYHLPKKK